MYHGGAPARLPTLVAALGALGYTPSVGLWPRMLRSFGRAAGHRPFTLILPYYDNAGMFLEQQRIWLSLPPDVRAALHVIVVDDASPRAPAVEHVRSDTVSAVASFRLFRTGIDVRWNWLFCRNLGVEEARTEWVLLTDMDHVVPEATWQRLMRVQLDDDRVYRLSRVLAPDNVALHPHPNTWIMTRAMFRERVGGYDERFSGTYGSDYEFRARVESRARAVHVLPDLAVAYVAPLIADACTTAYDREVETDREAKRAILAEIAALGDRRVPKRLTFPWTQVL